MTRIGESGDLLKCSFCGKTQKQVKKLIAGPGVYICDECIELCNEIIEDVITPNTVVEEEFLFEEDRLEIYHLVKKGDTLYRIALRYNITVDYLKKLNEITFDTISVSQRLRVK